MILLLAHPRTLLAVAVVVFTSPLAAADKTAADLLPASVVGYLDVPEPAKLVSLVVDHPLAGEVAKAPEYEQALSSPQFQHFQAVLKTMEDRLGEKWPAALTSLTSGGMVVGFDLPTQAGVVLVQAKDAEFATKARTAFLELARQAAADQGNANLVKEDSHRDVSISIVGDAQMAILGRWLVISNKGSLLRMVIDANAGEGETLAADEQFKKVTAARERQNSAWLYVDLRVLRLTGALKNALGKKSDNPPAEILAGGILGALPDAPYVTASLDASPSKLTLTAALPCDAKAVAKSREFYLGPEAAGRAPPLLATKGTLLSLSTYRDFASLWRHAPDLFDEGINAKFAEAESGLKTIFAGRDFRDEILGNVEPGVQIVVARQEFPQEGVTPAIKLPAAAAVFRMKDPVQTARIFKITFQSVIGFLNVAGAQNGVDPLDFNSERFGDVLVVSSGYLPPTDDKARGEAGLHYNASPTVAFVGDRFILASAKPIAMQLVEQVQREEPAAHGANTIARLDGAVGLAALAENRGPLIAQNMLEKGHDRAAAEKEIDRVLGALRVLKSSSLDLAVEESKLKLTLAIELAGAK